MTLAKDPHQTELRAAGCHSRGYLPHFDGIVIPQFITIHLADSLPKKVIQSWQEELRSLEFEQERILGLEATYRYKKVFSGRVGVPPEAGQQGA
ncbi:MAG TPA: hypothetical protein DHU55_01315 [Blastocatellia bacterium]|nr:hypothetical protein [Blastocatellia bacterium]HAF22396.1 hypothetical protein [Blastocatellia bacterium]HCX28403.1 hypothetical protein [Blastocatellia bacterium]